MVAKIYLIAVAALYFILAFWCTISPDETSTKVGFELKGASGQSEFMTVYGGLEFGMALLLLLSVLREETVGYGVLACVIVHASLVVFRTMSFFRYSEIDAFTYKLAAGEWAIALIGAAILLLQARGTSQAVQN